MKEIKTAEQIMKPRRGRPPGKRTVEKRVEKTLEEVTKSSAGRKPFTYDKRPEHIKFILDSAAMGYSSKRIQMLLIERYGSEAEEVVTVSTINSYKKRYAGEIQDREKALRAEIPGMLPSNRMRILQRVIDEAEVGEVIGIDNDNNPIRKKNSSVIVQAVKEMNAMMKDIQDTRTEGEDVSRKAKDLAEQKDVIRKWVKEYKDYNPHMSELNILNEITSGLEEEYLEAIKELTTEYTM